MTKTHTTIERVPLESVAESIFDGLRRPTSETGMALIRTSDIAGGVLSDLPERVSAKSIPKRYMISPGDVLVSKVAEEPKCTCVHAIPEPCVPASDIFVVRCKSELVLPQWVAAFLSSIAGVAALRTAAKGSRIRRLSLSDLKSFPIPLPPLADQQKVASLYQQVQEMSCSAHEDFQKVEALLKYEVEQRVGTPPAIPASAATSSLALGDRWDTPLLLGAPLLDFTRNHSLFQDIESLADLVTTTRRQIPQDALMTYVQSGDIDHHFLRFDRTRQALGSELPSRIRVPLEAGQVMITTSGQYLGTPRHPVAVVHPELDRCMASNAFQALSFDGTPLYFAMALRTPMVLRQMRLLASGATIPFLARRALAQVRIPVLGSVWRHDLDLKARDAWDKRKRALDLRNDLYAKVSAICGEEDSEL